MRLVLASASPRRAELLRAAGVTFVTCAVDADESTRPGEPAAAYVRRLAMEKSARAQNVLARPRTATDASVIGEPPIVIGADTAVVVDGEILGKPRDEAGAVSMLRRLSGRRHEVVTGVSVRRTDVECGGVESTVVYFSAMSDADIAWYAASGEGRDKAGAYAIQGLASRFVSRIEGSYSNVVGLPISRVLELIREATGETTPKRPA